MMGIAYNQQSLQRCVCMHAAMVSVLSNETRNLKYIFKIIAFRYLKFKQTRL